MVAKHKNLFLYMALICFISIIAIFVIDGYLGVYDTLYVTAEEREEEIGPDFWIEEDRTWSTAFTSGERVFFCYEVDNRQFSKYTADIEVSLWHSQERSPIW